MIADIAGFTGECLPLTMDANARKVFRITDQPLLNHLAWSSTRDPSQVFILLQTVYREFDEIARIRKVRIILEWRV